MNRKSIKRSSVLLLLSLATAGILHAQDRPTIQINGKDILPLEAVDEITIEEVESGQAANGVGLMDFLEAHPEYSLFYELVRLTEVYKRLPVLGEDPDYEAPSSMLDAFGSLTDAYPKSRPYGYTCFVEPNSVYQAAGITDIEGLKVYAKQWFSDTYAAAAPDIYAAGDNENYTDSLNYLNRFAAYHIVPKKIASSDFTAAAYSYMVGYEKYLDYAETLAPGQLLCLAAGRHTFPDDSYDGRLQLNPSAQEVPLSGEVGQRDWTRPTDTGVLLSGRTDTLALGFCHEVQALLTYPRSTFQRKRLRIDAAALFPEMMNAGIRYKEKELSGYALPEGFLSNVQFNSDDTRMWYQAVPEGYASPGWWNDYQGDQLTVSGVYDFTLKLPPVPAGMYEVRIGYTENASRGYAQMFLGSDPYGLMPAGIPVDFTVSGDVIGWEPDKGNVSDYDSDKLLRRNGFMKAPNSSRASGGTDTRSLRDVGSPDFPEYALRYVVGTINMMTDGNIYLRVRNASSGTAPTFMLDYIEICPNVVYDDPTQGEPRD